MHDLKKLRENPELLRVSLARKGFQADIQAALDLDEDRRKYILKADQLKAELNKASKAIGMAKKAGRDAAEEMEVARKLREEASGIDDKRRTVEKKLHDLLLTWPAQPSESAPDGKDASENIVVKKAILPEPPDFELADHLTIAENLGILDMPRGAKVAGTGWPLYVGPLARLERALINFMLDLHISNYGYTEVIVPFCVNPDSALGTGQLPKFPEDMYYIEQDDLYLIPTSEVPVTNLYRDELLNEKDLPVKLAAFSPCFRREAGAHGSETRGLLRMHQFNKVELVRIESQQNSEQVHEELLNQAASVLDQLEIPYRIIELCTGDLSFTSGKCYDIEAWSPATGNWLEVSSVSNFYDFQARRMNLRYRPDGGGKPEYAHTLNGSGMATSRVMVALIENYQTPEGRIRIPRALQSYMGGLDQITGSRS